MELEGTSRIIKLQPPCHRQGHQPPHLVLDQAAQGSIQPGLEHVQGQGNHSLSGQPVLARHHSQSKWLSPDIQPKSSLLNDFNNVFSWKISHVKNSNFYSCWLLCTEICFQWEKNILLSLLASILFLTKVLTKHFAIGNHISWYFLKHKHTEELLKFTVLFVCLFCFVFHICKLRRNSFHKWNERFPPLF